MTIRSINEGKFCAAMFALQGWCCQALFSSELRFVLMIALRKSVIMRAKCMNIQGEQDESNWAGESKCF